MPPNGMACKVITNDQFLLSCLPQVSSQHENFQRNRLEKNHLREKMMILASFFLLAAAMNFGYLFLLLLQRLLLLLLVLVPGWEDTMGKNCTPKMPNVTSETHRK